MTDQGDERQLVVFTLASEVYGVDIGAVREIIRMQSITFVPDSPVFVEGVINLRGRVIPVLDLRARFSLAVSDTTAETRIVVVHVDEEDIGMIVDSVTEVLSVPLDSIEPPSGLVTTDQSYYMDGIANLDDRLLILLDLDKVLSASEQNMLRETATPSAESIAEVETETESATAAVA